MLKFEHGSLSTLQRIQGKLDLVMSQPTPVFLRGDFYGHRSLAGYSPWERKGWDMTEWLTLSLFNPRRSVGSWCKFAYLHSNNIDQCINHWKNSSHHWTKIIKDNVYPFLNSLLCIKVLGNFVCLTSYTIGRGKCWFNDTSPQLFCILLFNQSVVSDSLRPHGL